MSSDIDEGELDWEPLRPHAEVALSATTLEALEGERRSDENLDDVVRRLAE